MEAQVFTCCKVKLALQVATEHLELEFSLVSGMALLEKASKTLEVQGQPKLVEFSAAIDGLMVCLLSRFSIVKKMNLGDIYFFKGNCF